jgi:hypothetical protein
VLCIARKKEQLYFCIVRNALNVDWFWGVIVSEDMTATTKQQHNSNPQSNVVDTVSNLPREAEE